MVARPGAFAVKQGGEDGMVLKAVTPAAMSATEMPALATAPGVPVTDRNPASAWISKS